MMKTIYLLLGMLFITTISALSFADADDGIVLGTTRVILDKESKTIQITNNGNTSYLIKSDLLVSPDNNKKNNTVIITPPLFKLAAHESRPIKLYKKNPPDSSVESLGYLAVLAIPALDKVSEENQNTVAVGLRNIIKVFIRPAALAEKKKDNDCLIAINKRNETITLKNNTPYFITLVAITLNDDAQNILPNTLMLSPLAQGSFLYNKEIPPNTQIHWQTINDYGFASEWCRSTLQHPHIK